MTSIWRLHREPASPSNGLEMEKARVLFVAGFRRPEDGAVPGGQAHFSRTLIASPLTEFTQWCLLDSTQESLPPPGVLRRTYLSFKRMARYSWQLVSFRPETVLLFSGNGLSFCEKGCMAVMASLLRKRVVFCPRSGLVVDDCRRNSIMRWAVRFVLRRCTYVVCQGGEWQDFFRRASGLALKRLPVIWNSVNAAEYAAVPELQARTPVTVLFLGWIERNKGVFDLVEAIAEIRHRFGPARVVMCGDGSDRVALEERVQRADLGSIIEFRGWVRGADKMHAISQCDLLVLPSYREGFPNVLLEAMAAGRPVLATSVGAVPELVQHRQTGMLCAPGDRKSLAESLLELCRDFELRRRLAVAGKRRITEQHDIARTWQQWWSVLRP